MTALCCAVMPVTCDNLTQAQYNGTTLHPSLNGAPCSQLELLWASGRINRAAVEQLRVWYAAAREAGFDQSCHCGAVCDYLVSLRRRGVL